jgi:hypothetical protein
MKRIELSAWDRTYLPSIFLGLWITSGHFFRNFFIQTLHFFGLFKHIPGSVTF